MPRGRPSVDHRGRTADLLGGVRRGLLVMTTRNVGGINPINGDYSVGDDFRSTPGAIGSGTMCIEGITIGGA